MKYNYSKALIELRSKLDISQTELASILGVVYASVNRWEKIEQLLLRLYEFALKNLQRNNKIE